MEASKKPRWNTFVVAGIQAIEEGDRTIALNHNPEREPVEELVRAANEHAAHAALLAECREGLRAAADALHFAGQMLDAINSSEPTKDRADSAKRTLAASRNARALLAKLDKGAA